MGQFVGNQNICTWAEIVDSSNLVFSYINSDFKALIWSTF